MERGVTWLDPWEPMPAVRHGNHEAELLRELGQGHPLYDAKVTAVAMRGDNDDVLFEIDGGEGGYVVVHLSWSGRPEPPPFPFSKLYRSFREWAENGMVRDNAEWEGRV